VVPAVVDGDLEGPLPGDLRARFPNLEVIDLRGLRGPRRYWSFALREKLEDEVVKIAGLLLDVPFARMPELRREEAKARAARNLRLASLAVGLAVGFLALAVLAWWSYRTAEEQRKLAVSRQLAADARAQQKERLDRGLLLAVAAYREEPTVEATNALFEGLAASPSLVRHLHGHSNRLSRIAFRPDGRTFASVDDDGRLLLWGPDGVARGPPVVKDGLDAVAFGNGGEWISAAGTDGAIRVWRTTDWKELCPPLDARHGPITSLLFLPDGRLLAGEYTGAIRGWDVKACREVHGLEHGATGPIYRMALDGRGSVLVTAHGDSSLQRFGLTGASRDPELLGAHTGVLDVAISSDGSIAASAGRNGRVVLHDVAKRKDLGTLAENLDSRAVALSSDGRIAAAGNGASVVLFDTRFQKMISTLPTGRTAAVSALELSPDGHQLAVGSQDGALQTFFVSGTPRNNPLGSALPGAFTNQVQDLAARGPSQPVAGVDLNNGVWAMDGATHSAVRCPWEAEAQAVALSEDGAELAAGANGGALARFTFPKCTPVAEVTADPGENVMRMAYAARAILAVTANGSLYAWPREGGAVTARPLKPGSMAAGDTVVSAAFSRGADRVALGWSNGHVQIAETRAAGRSWTSADGALAAANGLDFSPDGEWLVSGGDDGRVQFWKARDATPLALPIDIPGRRVFSVAIGSLGLAAIGYDDGGLELWDVQARAPLSPRMQEHDGFVTAVAFSQDGTRLYSGDEHGLVMSWVSDPAEWTRRACAIANRELGESEWRRYLPDQKPRPLCQLTPR
jgi:WD40 repeat protein